MKIENAYWNYRVVKIDEHGDELFCLMEAHYNHDGTPLGYTDPMVGCETIDGLKEQLQRMLLALDKPVMEHDDFKGLDQAWAVGE